jgi:ATP-dependent DNA helicase RecQ
MEQIVYSGTKLNIKYWVDEMLDKQEEIYDYFMESESKIEGA